MADKKNLDPGKLPNMSVHDIYEKVDKAFKDTDSKLSYLQEIQKGIQKQFDPDKGER